MYIISYQASIPTCIVVLYPWLFVAFNFIKADTVYVMYLCHCIAER